MERGIDFLKSQVNNAVMQHRAFLDALEDHEKQADSLTSLREAVVIARNEKEIAAFG